MSKMIQVRNVPERLHKELVRRAKDRSMSLSDYIKELLQREASRPPLKEVLERIESRTWDLPEGLTGGELVRAEREEREKGIQQWLDLWRTRRSSSTT